MAETELGGDRRELGLPFIDTLSVLNIVKRADSGFEIPEGHVNIKIYWMTDETIRIDLQATEPVLRSLIGRCLPDVG